MGSTDFTDKIRLAMGMSISQAQASDLRGIIDDMITERLKKLLATNTEIKLKIDMIVETEADKIAKEKEKRNAAILKYIKCWRNLSASEKNEFTSQEIIDWLSTDNNMYNIVDGTSVSSNHDFLSSDYGHRYLESEHGYKFLDNVFGKAFLQCDTTWLVSVSGQNWLASERGQAYLEMRIEYALKETTYVGSWCKWFYIWLRSERGLNWLVETDIGKRFALATGKLKQVFESYQDTFSSHMACCMAQKWLQTENGRTFLGSELAFHYLTTKDGIEFLEKNIAWLDETDAGRAFKNYVQTKLLDINGLFVKTIHDKGWYSKFFGEQDKNAAPEKQNDNPVLTDSNKPSWSDLLGPDSKPVLTDSEKQKNDESGFVASEKQDDAKALADWVSIG